MAKASAYSYIAVAATLDGQKVIGLWDGDDAITIEPGADVGTGLVGVDGSSIFSQHADRSANITIRLQHTSPTHRLLVEKWKQQQAGQLIGFPFDVMDKNSGEGGTAATCFVRTAPTDSKGRAAVSREWVIWTGEFEPATPNG